MLSENCLFLSVELLDRNLRGLSSIGTLDWIHISHILISSYVYSISSHILILPDRDGVSEGQFYQVLLYELDAIRRVSLSS